MNNKPIRVLVVDDSVTVRDVLVNMLQSDQSIEVVAEATNGLEAVQLVEQLKPDLVTMDLEMPVMNGHEAIVEIMSKNAVPIVVVSSLDDTENAYRAVSKGALEVIGKPQLDELESEALIRKVKLLSSVKVIRHVTSVSHQEKVKTGSYSVSNHSDNNPPPGIIAIVSSTGGPRALENILSQLTNDLTVPIVIAQHISPGFEQGMGDWLNSKSPLEVKIGQDGEKLLPGHVYISAADRHMTVVADDHIKYIAPSSTDIFFPSCDCLLNSVAKVYGKSALGVICTGMSKDGAAGMEAIHQAGGKTIAQDEESSVVFGMNQVAIEKHCIDKILPVAEIADEILSICCSKDISTCL